MDPSQDPMWEQVQKMILINGRIGILFKLFSDFFEGRDMGVEKHVYFLLSHSNKHPFCDLGSISNDTSLGGPLLELQSR